MPFDEELIELQSHFGLMSMILVIILYYHIIIISLLLQLLQQHGRRQCFKSASGCHSPVASS